MSKFLLSLLWGWWMQMHFHNGLILYCIFKQLKERVAHSVSLEFDTTSVTSINFFSGVLQEGNFQKKTMWYHCEWKDNHWVSEEKSQLKNRLLFVVWYIFHSPCWFLDIKFKEYSRSIQALKTEFSRSIQSKFTLSCTTRTVLEIKKNSRLSVCQKP